MFMAQKQQKNVEKYSMDPIVLGGARECLKARGKYMGRSEHDLSAAIRLKMESKLNSCTGVVQTLCISPKNGTRIPCNSIQIKQSIVGDAQSESGHPTIQAAKIKNRGALLGKENLYVESLLCAVSVGDQDVVQEIVQGNVSPQTEAVWVTGDNIYLSGIDLSWKNFGIGDLLVFPEVAILNSGYPHFACWKYAVRAGNEPKNYINSIEGIMYRLRGIKGAVLLKKENATCGVQHEDSVKIVRKGSPEYREIISAFRPPLREKEELKFHIGEQTLSASVDNTEAYINLLIHAGKFGARVDAKRYRRKLPKHVEFEIKEEQKAKM